MGTRPHPRTLLLLLVALPSLPCGLRGQAPGPAAEGREAGGIDAYRAELERQAADGGWWWTSNAEYREGEDDAVAYGVRHWIVDGGISAAGCLWSIRAGGAAPVHWRFYQGWDAARGAPFYYQAHVSGTSTGMGYQTQWGGAATVLVQEFGRSDGSVERVRHRVEWRDAATHLTRSATWSGERWEPNRSYTWTRRAAGPTPCGPGDR